MASDTIDVIVRQRPPEPGISRDNSTVVTIDDTSTTLSLAKPSAQDQNVQFKFRKVLGPTASQHDVFTCCGEPTVAGVLEGYNATVMAYGQTGAGKTHTVTGGADYEQRGLAPRVVSLLFNELAKKDSQATVALSYLEIHNEQIFDLLATASEDCEGGPLTILEDGHNATVRGLGIMP